MSKKLILSQKQIREALEIDEDMFSYFDDNSNSDGTTQVTTDGRIEDADGNVDYPQDSVFGVTKYKDGKHYHGSKYDGDHADVDLKYDDMDKKLAPTEFMSNIGRKTNDNRGALVTMEESKKKINEDNQDLAGDTYHIPDNLYQILQQNYARLGDKAPKRLESLVKNRDVKYKEMYRLKGVFDGTDKKFHGNKMDFGGDAMAQWVNNTLNTNTNISRRKKEADRDLGNENAFIKSHKKNSGNGQAHTAKQDGIIRFF